MSDLEELRRLSEAATPGRWRTFGMTLMVGGDGDYEDATEVAHFLTERDGHPRTFDLDLACALVNAYRDGSLSNPTSSVSTEGVALEVPVSLIRSEWPPNPDLTPGGSPRFDAVYDSLARGEPMHTPITIKSDWSVIDGMHRLTAARLLGLATIPVRVWTGHEWLPALRLTAINPDSPVEPSDG